MVVERWGANLYGDPCAGCGYDWSITADEAIRLIGGLSSRYRALLAGHTGSERHGDLAWSATGYVCHVVDNLRIWAEGLAGARLSGEIRVPGYDPDLLAAARRYDRVALSSALWSLEHAVTAWSESVRAALDADTVLQHAGRGAQRAQDVARNNAHDAHHHGWDIERILVATGHPLSSACPPGGAG